MDWALAFFHMDAPAAFVLVSVSVGMTIYGCVRRSTACEITAASQQRKE